MKDSTCEAEFHDYRVRYAVHYENDGPADIRAAVVAARAARAMRDGNRYMDGSARTSRTPMRTEHPSKNAERTPAQYTDRTFTPVPDGPAALTDITIAHSRNVSVLHALLHEQDQAQAG